MYVCVEVPSVIMNHAVGSRGPYPLEEGPVGMLKVFCRLNLPVVMQSADWDRLMLRFLKNSKPPVELGSWTGGNTGTHGVLMSLL